MFFRRKSLNEYLDQTKKIKIEGIIFEIKKINPLDYLDGSKSVKAIYDTYKTNNQNPDVAIGKIKAHYTDVILAGVVTPCLSRNEKDEGIFIERLFEHWNIIERLYEEIMLFTYGKKKLQ